MQTDNQIQNESARIKAGWHVGKKDLYQTLLGVATAGGSAAQVYMSNRNSFFPGADLTQEEVEKICSFRKETGFYLVCHSKLLLNLCQNDQTDPRVLPALICDMRAADRLGADIVVHQGKNVAKLNLSREEALMRYVLNLQAAIDATPELSNRILLENSCQQGTELGYTLQELVMIWRLLEPEYHVRIGFCLDTCHAHVGGMMDLSSSQSVAETFQEFDRKIGLEHLGVIHFNDSEIRFDGHNDSHADLLIGHGGNPGLGGTTMGLQKVVEYAKKHCIPLVLETPGKVPVLSQLRLILGWAHEGPDIEGEYVVNYQETMSAFAANPCSRKGRKKKVVTDDTTVPKIVPLIVPRRVPAQKPITLLKPLKILPRLKNNSK